MSSLRRTVVACLCLAGLSGGAVRADEARYLYDDLGRLARIVDGQGNVATWTYDAVGNVLRVEQSLVSDVQPRIGAVTPAVVRQGATTTVTITGASLAVSRVSTDNPDIVVGRTAATDTVVTATFVVAGTARLGPATVTVDNGAGTASAAMTVGAAAPRLLIAPNVVALEPGGKTAGLELRLSNADSFATVVSWTGGDAGVAALNPTELTIPAGETVARATVTVTSGAQGTTAWTATTDGGTFGVTVSVAPPLRGPALALAPLLSLDLRAPLPPVTPVMASQVSVWLAASPPPVTPVMSPHVGVDLPAVSAPVTPIIAPPVSVGLAEPE